VLPKAPLYSGGSPSAWVSDLTSTYAGQYPVVNTTKDPNLYVAVPHTGDFTVTTYSGAATSSAPKFTKSVLYPRSMTAPPVVDQGAGDLLNLGALRVTTATMRAGTLYASLSEGCQTDTHACVRLIGVSVTGMSLQLDKTFSKTGGDLMAPAVAVDTSGRPHVAYQVVASGSSTGPSLAVTVRKAPTSSKWTGSLLRRSVVAVSDGDATEETIDWSGYAGAAIDPASPWDVWVTGAWGDNPAAAGAPTWSSTVARASIALNVATVKPAKTKVPKGQKVSITGKLARPQSTSTIKGLPVALQFKPKSGGSWTTKKSGSVAADGTLKWTVKITKTGSWRLVGKGVTQSSSGGRLVTKSVGKAVTITAT
jgi:hypothetical protein